MAWGSSTETWSPKSKWEERCAPAGVESWPSSCTAFIYQMHFRQWAGDSLMPAFPSRVSRCPLPTLCWCPVARWTLAGFCRKCPGLFLPDPCKHWGRPGPGSHLWCAGTTGHVRAGSGLFSEFSTLLHSLLYCLSPYSGSHFSKPEKGVLSLPLVNDLACFYVTNQISFPTNSVKRQWLQNAQAQLSLRGCITVDMVIMVLVLE
jgi:hypothetical protein